MHASDWMWRPCMHLHARGGGGGPKAACQHIGWRKETGRCDFQRRCSRHVWHLQRHAQQSGWPCKAAKGLPPTQACMGQGMHGARESPAQATASTMQRQHSPIAGKWPPGGIRPSCPAHPPLLRPPAPVLQARRQRIVGCACGTQLIASRQAPPSPQPLPALAAPDGRHWTSRSHMPGMHLDVGPWRPHPWGGGGGCRRMCACFFVCRVDGVRVRVLGEAAISAGSVQEEPAVAS